MKECVYASVCVGFHPVLEGVCWWSSCQCVCLTATAQSQLYCIPSSLWDGNESFLTAPPPVTQRGGWRRVEEEEEEAALRHHQPPRCPFALSS